MDKILKVLWFCNTPANGDLALGLNGHGSGTWLKTLDIEIQAKVELHVAFYHSSDLDYSAGKTRYHSIKRYKNITVKIINKFAERFFDYVRDDSNLDAYLDIVNKVKPDLIHIHGTENSFGCLVHATSIPIVVSIQGILSEIDEFYCRGLGDKLMSIRGFGFASLKEFIFPTNFRNAKLKFSRMAEIERRNMNALLHIIGRTSWDRRVTGFLAPSSRYYHNDEIMRNDFRNFSWSPPKKSTQIIRLHTTSDNVYYKGLEVVCLSILHLRGLGYSCEWNVAGVKDGDLIVKVLKKKFGKFFPNCEINFMGKISAGDLIDSMLNSDMFVMPSNIENSPNSLCEAMLLGMPCIATSVGGTSDFLNNDSGVLVQAGDSISMAAAIIDLYRNPEKCIEYSRKARLAAIERHNPERIVGDLVDIYKSIACPGQSISVM